MALRWFQLKRKNGDLKCYACGYYVDELFVAAPSAEKAQASRDDAVCWECADLGLIYFNVKRTDYPVVELGEEKPADNELYGPRGEFPFGEFGGGDQVPYERFTRSNFPDVS